MTGVEIREATRDDWDQIWPFFPADRPRRRDLRLPGGPDVRERYAGLVRAAGRPRGRRRRRPAAVRRDSPSPAQPARPRAGMWSTASFMVDPEPGGKGVGRALGEYVLGWASNAGFRSMQFNAVVETNVACRLACGARWASR